MSPHAKFLLASQFDMYWPFESADYVPNVTLIRHYIVYWVIAAQ